MKQKLRSDGEKMLKVKRNLLGINELTSEEIEHILDTTRSFKEVSKRSIKKVPTLRGRTIANFFLEPSTRTRTSFELAAKRLSADVINISAETSAVAKGESLKDTAKTIQALGADLVVIRHSAAGAPYFLTKIINCPVVNAGDGAHEHPTQALVDLYTIRERMGKIAGLKVAIVGDVAHSRVARSNILGLTKMGAEVTLVGPPTLIPLNIESLGASVDYSFESVLRDVDVVYLLRLQLERQNGLQFPSLREYTNLYGVDMRRLKLMKDKVMIMHPGPMNRGIEISSEVADLSQVAVTEQVTNGIAVRMAVLYLLIGGGEI
ncbi:MAG TPA: aspartate carbamoyltransferase catalytic subunit [Candidatus Subteraquimicrobiales bacterium]